MQHKVLPNGNLRISIDADEQKILSQTKAELGEEFGCNDVMYDTFEHLIANSELDWVNPEDIGALTNAPILGTFGETNTKACGRHVGHWDDKDWYDPIVDAWGFMSYALMSPQDVLLKQGYVDFQHG